MGVLMKKLICIIGVVLLLMGCSAEEYGIPKAPSEDNRLVIYTPYSEEVYAPLVKEFEERTGIWVEIHTGSVSEFIGRLKSGEETCDVIFGGTGDIFETEAALFEEYYVSRRGEISPEYLTESGIWTPFSGNPPVLVYNPKLVRNNPPTGWKDLIDPVWSGKIAFADPLQSSLGYNALTMLQQLMPEGGQLAEHLSENIGEVLQDSSDEVVKEIANGNYYVGVAYEETVLRGLQKGYDIMLVYPDEGSFAIVDGLAIVSGSSHRENAESFIEFAVCEDVQRYISQNLYRRPVYGGELFNNGGKGME